MADTFIRGLLRDQDVVVSVAVTTKLCREAQHLHELAATSAVALGRLMTATVLTGLAQKKLGALSLQVVSSGRLKQIFSDITDTGNVRGFVRPTDLGIPPLSEEQRTGRRTLSHAVGGGVLSVIRTTSEEPHSQSSTELVAGEIDVDVEHFLETSDQIPSTLATDVLLDAEDRVVMAGGALAQAMPGGQSRALTRARSLLSLGGFSRLLSSSAGDANRLFAAVFPEAKRIDDSAVRWQCRCSMERVLASLTMLEPSDFADLVNQNKGAQVTCDFCGTAYPVTPEQIRRVHESTIRGHA
jgi:molecular chaperone Hsp33